MICHFLRALEYQPRDGRQLELHDLAPKIGEEPHSAPSVFGYFSPSTSRPGPCGVRVWCRRRRVTDGALHPGPGERPRGG